jgi:hypothetical protein
MPANGLLEQLQQWIYTPNLDAALLKMWCI